MDQAWVQGKAGVDRRMTSKERTFRRAAATVLPALMALAAAPSCAAPCAFEPQGEGHVTDVTGGNSFRLSDGREIRLAGVEPFSSDITRAAHGAALTAIILDQDVILRGENDTPDRYGRQSAFVFLKDSDTPVQSRLLADGAALLSVEITDKDCMAALAAAETAARTAKKGVWSDPAAIKNAESADDILAGIGRFTLVEGKVLSVRQAGATTYLNFGRRWTRDFAVTISRRMLAAVEAAGMPVKSLENRRILVRGWVEAHPGPRIEVTKAGQIEVLGGN
jgi:endonuclease YncB( thermonuclease family)